MEEKDSGKEIEIYTTVLEEWKPALGTLTPPAFKSIYSRET